MRARQGRRSIPYLALLNAPRATTMHRSRWSTPQRALAGRNQFQGRRPLTDPYMGPGLPYGGRPLWIGRAGRRRSSSPVPGRGDGARFGPPRNGVASRPSGRHSAPPGLHGESPGQRREPAVRARLVPARRRPWAECDPPIAWPDPPPDATPGAGKCRSVGWRGARSFTHTYEGRAVFVVVEAESVLHLSSDVMTVSISFRFLALGATCPRNFCRCHVAESCVKGMQSTGTEQAGTHTTHRHYVVNPPPSGHSW